MNEEKEHEHPLEKEGRTSVEFDDLMDEIAEEVETVDENSTATKDDVLSKLEDAKDLVREASHMADRIGLFGEETNNIMDIGCLIDERVGDIEDL